MCPGNRLMMQRRAGLDALRVPHSTSILRVPPPRIRHSLDALCTSAVLLVWATTSP